MNLEMLKEALLWAAWGLSTGAAFNFFLLLRKYEKRSKENENTLDSVLKANHALAVEVFKETKLRQELQKQLSIRTEKLREIRLQAWRLTNEYPSHDCTCISCQSFNILKDIGLQKDESQGGAL